MPERKLSFSQFEIAHLEQVLPGLERIFREHGIDFYILGGLARDIIFLKEGITPQRITRDVDLAAFIPNPPAYELLLQDLVGNERFERISANPVRLLHPSGVVVDILPFNEMTSNSTELVRFGPALVEFNLKGLHEVFEKSVREYAIEGEHRYKVTTPEAIIFLKLLAYDNKPEWRQKDLEDIGQLMLHYFNLNDNDIYENHNELFEEERELEEISARVIGRKIKVILEANSLIYQTFKALLSKFIGNPSATIFTILSREMKRTPEDIQEYFKEIKIGLEENLP
ncbi:MAG: hypothetical protein R2828_17915 [Saprospiraceae bacterium]